MMRTVTAWVFVFVLLFLNLVGIVGAQIEDVTYEDTRSNFNGPRPRLRQPPQSFIRNGDFLSWSVANLNPEINSPDHWFIWAEDKEGWADVHLAMVNLARLSNPDGINNGLGFFVQHAGGEGSYYAGARQQLVDIPAAGYYVVNVHATGWYDHARETAPYNSMAWYAISSAENWTDVAAAEWRELFATPTLCSNARQRCDYLGRAETVWIEPGQYFHLRVGHNFPVLFASTVFVIDDISIVAANTQFTETAGFYDTDDTVRWNRRVPR